MVLELILTILIFCLAT